MHLKSFTTCGLRIASLSKQTRGGDVNHSALAESSRVCQHHKRAAANLPARACFHFRNQHPAGQATTAQTLKGTKGLFLPWPISRLLLSMKSKTKHNEPKHLASFSQNPGKAASYTDILVPIAGAFVLAEATTRRKDLFPTTTDRLPQTNPPLPDT